MNTSSILVPGKNCWKLEKADRASFLVDGDAYFRAFRESVKLARKNVYICGWDIDSRIHLLSNDPRDDLPLQLGDFLNAVAESKKDLRIYILIWDFVRLMGIDREWFPQFKLGWETHKNIRFSLDSFHPIGASHHHKVVVIDDALAFVGGLDLTRERWDTTGHQVRDKRRRSPEGELYRPHHDIQMMVSGEPAQSLGTYFRYQWKLAAGEDLPTDSHPPSFGENWPRVVEVDATDCRIGIARTRPAYKGVPEIHEVQKLYLAAIEKAESYIYIENQYLTAPNITRALVRRLQDENGPEVIIVLPYSTDGWLSQYTMDILRAQAIKVLYEADTRNRLGILYAHKEGLTGDDTIKIHSKLMIVDDRFVRIGSSNLNNRSMGFDTECDLALEAERGDKAGKAIEHLRNRLLGEHLGVTPADVQKAVGRSGSLLRAIAELRGNSRSLEKLEVAFASTAAFIAEEQDLFDPDRPIEPEVFASHWLPLEQLQKGRFRFIQLTVLLLLFLGGALAWQFTSLQEYLSVDNVKKAVVFLQNSDLAILYIIGAYAAGSLLVVPITVLITLTVLVYGMYKGFLLALLGSVISGIITYWLGRIIGRDFVRSLAGNKLTALSHKLARRGILSTFIIRLMPIAPYSVVNVVAGATHIRFIDFVIGTVLGLMPGILAISGLVDRGYALVKNPDFITVSSAVGVFAGVFLAFYFIQKKLRLRKE